MTPTASTDAGHPLRLDGLVAIVTGAARGLGAAHARTFADRGACVVVNDLAPPDSSEPETIDAVVAGIAASGGQAAAVLGSVTDEATRAALVSTAVERFGRLDIVVNNAGMGVPHPLGELDAGHLRLEYDVHVVGALMLVDAAWPHLCERGGSIVSTTSGVGMFGMQGAIGYASAKAALLGANRVLALEGHRAGVRSNLVAPIADTRMAGGVFGDLTPHLSPDLVAAAVTWLVHPNCPLTGEVLSVGGGRIARAITSVNRGHRAATPEEVRDEWASVSCDVQLEVDDALRETDLTRDVLRLGPAEDLNHTE